ncbi:hypothetical protein [Halobacillus mangrovi]|nr:hypothetical protein [Halobacillus mangrovi]
MEKNEELALSIYALALSIAERTSKTYASYELRDVIQKLHGKLDLN